MGKVWLAYDLGVHREVEVGFSVLFLDKDTLPVILLGKQKGKTLIGQVVFLPGLGKKIVPFRISDSRARWNRDRHNLFEDQPQVKTVDLRLEMKR